MRRGRRLVRREDLLMLRHRPLRLLSTMLTRGIVGTTRVLLMVQVKLLVVVQEVVWGLWCTMQQAWVLPLRQLEARPVMLVRRLAGKRCEAVPVRWMQPRQQAWLRVRRW